MLVLNKNMFNKHDIFMLGGQLSRNAVVFLFMSSARTIQTNDLKEVQYEIYLSTTNYIATHIMFEN